MIPEAEFSIAIDAPIAEVWAVMTDAKGYSEWNPFVVGLQVREGALRIGALVELTVRWPSGGGARTVEQVTRLEAPAAGPDGVWRATMEYAYTGLLPRLNLVRGSRRQSLEQAPGGPTVYRSYEAFYGWLRGFVPLAKVRAGFEAHGRALQQRVRRSA
jgi:hypothetical protein